MGLGSATHSNHDNEGGVRWPFAASAASPDEAPSIATPGCQDAVRAVVDGGPVCRRLNQTATLAGSNRSYSFLTTA